MTETETEIEEKMRKKKEEEEAMWADYIEQRKAQRAKEEEELKKLKERQVRRKAQRADQEKQLLAMKKKQEEAKQREIDEKKAKDAEAKRKRLEESEKKRQAMLDAMKEKDNSAAKPNFVISKQGGSVPVSGAVSKSDVIKTKEQLAEDKRVAMALRMKKLDYDGLGEEKLRQKCTEMWDLIVQLESDKYDLEERRKRQDYDLKELTERQKQMNRNKALKKGLDPEAFTGKYPPKINTSSKYERRVDRRTFGDKKTLFEGGWEELYKQHMEKNWTDRNTEWKEKDTPKLMTWNPNNPRNRETYEGRREAFDDEEDEIDIMQFQPKEPEPVRQAVRQPTPEPTEEEEEEVEAEEEEDEEEEEEDEEEEE